MRTTPRVAGFRSEYPAGFELECMAGFVGIRTRGTFRLLDLLASASQPVDSSSIVAGYMHLRGEL